jgi:transcription initiation factor TFIIIB Brf1 subunit/transcription initiation factor TFIIB
MSSNRVYVRSVSPVPKHRPHSYPVSKEDHDTILNSKKQEINNLIKLVENNHIYEEHTTNKNINLKTLDCGADEDFLNDNSCNHTETEIVNGVVECVNCGVHLDTVIDEDQECRYYGATDNKYSSDPSRCQYRKSPDKGIRKDLEKLHLPPYIINTADEYYQEVTQNEIKRGALRKGIMFACVFEAYKHHNKTQIPDVLQALFKIDKKNGSRGITYFRKKKRKNDDRYITAEDFIPKICEKFDFVPEAIQEVIDLYRQLKAKSPKLDHSYPQSVSSGCVYYVMKRKNVDITGDYFGKKVGLSSITVIKKANEIEEILNSE